MNVDYDRNPIQSHIRKLEYKGRKYSLRKFAFVTSVTRMAIIIDPYTGDELSLMTAISTIVIPLNYVNKHGAPNGFHSKKHQYATVLE